MDEKEWLKYKMHGSDERPKRTYMSREDAKRVAKEMSKRQHEKYNAYPCEFCDYYHVGHVNVKAREAARERMSRVDVTGVTDDELVETLDLDDEMALLRSLDEE